MSAFRILTVCTANICRSALTELLLRDQLDPHVFEISSAGVMGWDNALMDAGAAAEAERIGVDPSDFRSRPIVRELVEAADVILTATKEHRSAVLERWPGALRRTFTLKEFAALAEFVPGQSAAEVVAAAAKNRSRGPDDADIADPYGGSAAVHRRAAEQIQQAVRSIAMTLAAAREISA